MEFRDYITVIRRRFYVFIPVFLAVIGAHLLWVTYGQKPTYEATTQLAVMGPNMAGSSRDTFSPLGWVRATSASAVKIAAENRVVQKKISDLLWGKSKFNLPDFTMPPLKEKLEEYLSEFQAKHKNQLDFVTNMSNYLDIKIDPNQSVIYLNTTAGNQADALLISWAAAEGIIQHFNYNIEKDINHIDQMFDKEADEIKAKLKDADQKWAKVVQEVGFDPIEREKRLKSEVGDIQGELDHLFAVQGELARHYKELVQARPIGEGNPRSLQADEVLRENERVKGYQERIVKLKLKRDELLEVRTPEHPEIVEIEDRIKVLEQRFPEVIKEELAKSLVKLNDRKLNDILYQSRKTALDREVKQEQLAAMKQKIKDLAAKDVVYYPVKENFDRLRQEYRKLLANKINIKLIGAANMLGNVRLLEPSDTAMRLPLKGVGPGPIVLSLLLALICGISMAYLVEYVDLKVKNESDIRRYLNLPLLGVVPQVSKNQLDEINVDGHEVAERFNTAATLVRTTARELDLHTFAVCSAISKEGKTTVSINMAAALARKGLNVVLVDSDLRVPHIHSVLRLNNSFGLSTVLSGWVSPKQIIDGVMGSSNVDGKTVSVRDALQNTSVPGLRVLTSGPMVSTPAQLIESDLFPQVLRQLTEEADYVIFDTPPIDRVSDGLTIASMVDGCIFVVGAGQCEQRDITWAKHLLTNVQANLLGVFLNRYSYGKTREYEYYTRIKKKVTSTV